MPLRIWPLFSNGCSNNMLGFLGVMCCLGYISRFRLHVNYCMWLFILECAKMTNSVRALGYWSLLCSEIILTVLLCFK